MEATEYLDLLKDDDAFIRVHHETERGAGRGYGLIIDDEHNIAVMVTDCGFPKDTRLPRGAIIKFSQHPEAEPRVIGTPAFYKPIHIEGEEIR